MNVVIFGASGMVGKGVLLECLDSPDVQRVVVVGRTPVGMQHAKLDEVLHKDFTDYGAIADRLRGLDACFFCLGVSSAGMSEDDYKRVSYDFTIAAAEALLALNPSMVFTYVSGQGTDSTEKGRSMWARVKGATENKLLSMGFKQAVMFRPGMIEARRGITSRTPAYRVLYVFFKPLFPVLHAVFPNAVTTTERIGRAMINAVKRGAPKNILDAKDINALAA